MVQEVTPEGTIVYQWNSWEHLDVETDVICHLEGRREWTHQNALNVTPTGDLLVSFRQTSTVGIVDKSSGEFKWTWGPGEISHQHCPTFLENGRVLLFDNGPHRPGVSYSRIVEVDPATNQVTWEYRGDPPISFYSYQISGAQRLPNGNTLVCEGGPGRIFEVTPHKEIVWEYINPFYAQSGAAVGGQHHRLRQLGVPGPPLWAGPSGFAGQRPGPGPLFQYQPPPRRRIAAGYPGGDSIDGYR